MMRLYYMDIQVCIILCNNTLHPAYITYAFYNVVCIFRFDILNHSP